MVESIDDGLLHIHDNLDPLLDDLTSRFDAKTTTPPHTHPRPESIHLVDEAGRYIIPTDHIWAAHRRLILNPDLLIGFSSNRYPSFDALIAHSVHFNALFDPHNRHYPTYHTLRENIAIVRNVVMIELFAQANIGTSLNQRIAQLHQIGTLIAEGLNNDKLLPNPFKARIIKSTANIPAIGARHIYEQIIQRQDATHWLGTLVNLIYGARHWGLPAVEQSPFSLENLTKPAPADEYVIDPDDLASVCDMMDRNSITPVEMANHYVEGISHMADDLAQSGSLQNSIDSLREPTRRESVEIAKEILRKLKVKLGEALIVNGLTSVTSSNYAILDALKGVVGVYEFHLHRLLQYDPKALLNPTIALANDAIGKLGFIAKLEALRVAQKSSNSKQVKAITEQIKKMPPHWRQPKEQRFGQLFEQMENGLNTVITRLSQLSDPKAAVTNFVGRQNFQAVGSIDPAYEKSHNPQQAMTNNEAYHQINAQKQHQQSNALHSKQGRTLERDIVNKSASNAPKKSKIDKLVNPNDIASMRNQMRTDSNAGPVLVGAQARQAQLNQEKARLEQAARLQRMKTVQNANRAKQVDEDHQRDSDHKHDKHHKEHKPHHDTHHKDTAHHPDSSHKHHDEHQSAKPQKSGIKDPLNPSKHHKDTDHQKDNLKPKDGHNLAAPIDTKMIEAPLSSNKKKDPSQLR